MKLLPPALTQSGTMTLWPEGEPDPINLERRTEAGMQLVRWRHISLVFQGAMNSLDPVQRIDLQMAEAIRLHTEDGSGKAVGKRISELFKTVGLPVSAARRYPHQLSGGQRQRVMIALALACDPSVVIADEPTTALDVVMQAQVLQLLERLREQLGLALILISHDLGVLAETCDRIAVMYAGRIVETGPVSDVFADPQHPYTKLLLDSLPVIGGDRELAAPIPGAPPDPGDPPEGCRFRPRCPFAQEECIQDPPLREVRPSHSAACHFAPWKRWPAVRAAGGAGEGAGR
jgi:peptide/nickel transport system ATP-binding protein